MKNILFLIFILVFAGLIFWSCSDDNGTEPEKDTEAPVVTLTLPADSAEFTEGTEVNISANAGDNEAVAKVEFYVDSILVGTDEESPYQTSWTTTGKIGSHIIMAKAFDTSGNTGYSDTINVKVILANIAPVIDSLKANPTSVLQSCSTTLTCTAADANGDSLIYSWASTGGTLAASTSASVVWTAPTTSGTYTVLVTVSDGELSDSDSTTVIVNESGMIYVAGGTFSMGDHFSEGNPDELPLHNVTISSYYIGKCEVTNQEYCDMLNYANGQGLISVDATLVMGKIGSSQVVLLRMDDIANYQINYDGTNFIVNEAFENYPVNQVTWYGSVFYCNMMSIQHGLVCAYDMTDWSCKWDVNGYRLPTEAEWEYAARGGINNSDNYRYSGCNTESLLKNYAWYLANSNTAGNSNELNNYGTLPVATRTPNQLGVYDMTGNVAEWCWDWYSSEYYQYCIDNNINTNPRGPESGLTRAVRGGAWTSNSTRCRVAIRDGNYYPYYRYSSNGFRISRMP
jgi:formylglycine-generating enzyme required for sulfatase activity